MTRTLIIPGGAKPGGPWGSFFDSELLDGAVIRLDAAARDPAPGTVYLSGDDIGLPPRRKK